MLCFYLFDFYVARSVQLVLVQGQQLALQVDTTEKHGLQKDHRMRTCIPRTLSSAWRTRRILTDLHLKESQPERGQFGCGRARCRELMTLMKSKKVRKTTEHKYCSAYVMFTCAVKNTFLCMCTAAAPNSPDFVCSPLLCKAPCV